MKALTTWSVLSVSPALLENYLSAARTISRLAVSDLALRCDARATAGVLRQLDPDPASVTTSTARYGKLGDL
jgi:hypothetical protein